MPMGTFSKWLRTSFVTNGATKGFQKRALNSGWLGKRTPGRSKFSPVIEMTGKRSLERSRRVIMEIKLTSLDNHAPSSEISRLRIRKLRGSVGRFFTTSDNALILPVGMAVIMSSLSLSSQSSSRWVAIETYRKMWDWARGRNARQVRVHEISDFLSFSRRSMISSMIS